MAEAIQYLTDDQTAITPQLSLTPVSPAATQPPSEEIATRRASKTSQGLGDLLQYPQEVIHQQFIAGQESALRNEASLKIDMANRQKKLQDLRFLSGSSLGAVDSLAPGVLTTPRSDPDMVIEKGYTDNTLSSLHTAAASLVDTPWSDQAKTFPEVQAQTIKTASDFGTKREFLQTFKENVDQEVANQTYFGRGVDELKKFSQIYQEAKLRGNIDGVSIFAGIGLGSNIEAQARKLFDMDNDTFKKTVAPVLIKLRQDNPSLAADYIDQLLGQSDNEKLLS